jgi:hypothetical protein
MYGIPERLQLEHPIAAKLKSKLEQDPCEFEREGERERERENEEFEARY